ncbi:MAG: arginase family protein [Gemmatimonadales bacterium]
MTTWVLIGAPLDGSGEDRGEVRSPWALRAAGIVERLELEDAGDLNIRAGTRLRDPATGVVATDDVVAGSRSIRAEVSRVLQRGKRPLVVGGCCSILPGAFAGAVRTLGRTGLAFVDGHLDLHDGSTTRTGNLAGMALAVLLNHGAPAFTGLAGWVPMLSGEDLVAVGYHESLAAEGAVAADLVAPGATFLPASEITTADPAAIGRRIRTSFERNRLPFWIHFDVDVVDPSFMPAVNYPGHSGVTWEHVGELLGALGPSPALAGVSVADFDAGRDPGGHYASLIAGALSRITHQSTIRSGRRS